MQTKPIAARFEFLPAPAFCGLGFFGAAFLMPQDAVEDTPRDAVLLRISAWVAATACRDAFYSALVVAFAWEFCVFAVLGFHSSNECVFIVVTGVGSRT